MNRAEIATIRLDCRADRIATARRVETALRIDGGLSVIVLLQPELDRLNFASAEHICIRRLEVPLRIRVSHTTGDAGIRQVWGSAVGLALGARLAEASLRARSPGVLVSADGELVVYRRRLDAVADLVAGLSETGSPDADSGVVRSDVSRVWAWRQCGLLSGPRGGSVPRSLAARAEAITAALTATPELVPAVLARLGNALPLMPVHWLAVATAWAAAQTTPPEPDQAPATTVSPADPVVRAAVHSPVGRAVARHISSLSRLPRADRAVLARLALVCSLPHRSYDGPAVAAIARAWEQVPEDIRPAPEPTVAPPGEEVARVELRPQRQPTARAPAADRGPPGAPTSKGGPLDVPHRAEPHGARRHDHPAEPRSRAEWPTAEAPDDPEPEVLDAGTGPVEYSDLAGLLFLAPAIGFVLAPEVAAVDLPEAVARLCRRLAGGEREDAAVRALCGINADAAVSATDERLDDRLERRIREWIAARLDHGRLEEDLNWIWWRRAAIEITPGWIEAEFAVADVDLRIRQAMLDVDPGWLWWRGAVLRFRYV